MDSSCVLSRETLVTAVAAQTPRFEAHDRPPFLQTVGFGWQFSLIASATLLVTPVIVAEASDLGEGYVTWMVFASLIVVGISTLIQTRRIGSIGAGHHLADVHRRFRDPVLHQCGC